MQEWQGAEQERASLAPQRLPLSPIVPSQMCSFTWSSTGPNLSFRSNPGSHFCQKAFLFWPSLQPGLTRSTHTFPANAFKHQVPLSALGVNIVQLVRPVSPTRLWGLWERGSFQLACRCGWAISWNWVKDEVIRVIKGEVPPPQFSSWFYVNYSL